MAHLEALPTQARLFTAFLVACPVPQVPKLKLAVERFVMMMRTMFHEVRACVHVY